MKKKLKTNAFLIKKQPYGETSLLMQVFSDTQGMISVLAKGLRKTKQQEDVLLNTLNEYEFVLAEPLEPGLYILSEMAALHDFPTDLPIQTWLAAQAGAELLVKLMLPVDEIPMFYNSLKQYLLYQENVKTNAIAIFWRWCLNLDRLLGIPLDLEHCSHCHRDMQATAAYSPESGQLICADCEILMSYSYRFDPETANVLSLLPQIGNFINDITLTPVIIHSLNHFFLHYLSVNFHQKLKLNSLEAIEQL